MTIQPDLERHRVPIDSLQPYGRNPRRGNVAAIKDSLRVHGQYRPIVVRTATREVLAGNHTLAAARELGWDQIAATFVDVDEQQAAQIVLVDNRTNDLATWDDGELLELLESLDSLDGTGFEATDLDELLVSLDAAPDRDTDPAERPADPSTATGDIWVLGEHRLMCADCTDPAAVRHLAGDQPVDMVWTDPPYGVDLGPIAAQRGIDHGDMEGDDADPDATRELVAAALEIAALATRPGGAIYVSHPETGGLIFREAFAAAGWLHKQTLIWVKQTLVLGRQDYKWQHEPILYGWKPGGAHHWHGGFTDTTVIDDDVDIRKLDKRQLIALVRELQNERASTVIREDKPHRAELHPTAKPVALVARCIRNSSRAGDTVLEPFAGAGSTLIAAENLRRRCLAIEIDPGYCDVIVDRWERHTGRTATLEAVRVAA